MMGVLNWVADTYTCGELCVLLLAPVELLPGVEVGNSTVAGEKKG